MRAQTIEAVTTARQQEFRDQKLHLQRRGPEQELVFACYVCDVYVSADVDEVRMHCFGSEDENARQVLFSARPDNRPFVPHHIAWRTKMQEQEDYDVNQSVKSFEKLCAMDLFDMLDEDRPEWDQSDEDSAPTPRKRAKDADTRGVK
jgi:hypothetical protein